MNYPSDEFDPANFLPAAKPAKGPKGTDSVQSAEGLVVYARQPHLGYALLAIFVGCIAFVVATLALFAAGAVAEFAAQRLTGQPLHVLPNLDQLKANQLPAASVLLEALAYLIALAVIVPLFQFLWRRPFADVVQLNWPAARRNAGKLALTGVAVAVIAQLAESHMSLPKEIPLDAFFKSSLTVWMVAIFGTILAPITEELVFRGFLLRGFAIAFDWVDHLRTAAGRERWKTSDKLTRQAWIFSAILTSILFGLMHAAQLGFAWNAVAVLSVVGGILCAVRLHFNSLAASSLVHVVYNGFIFVVLFFATDGFRHLDKMPGR